MKERDSNKNGSGMRRNVVWHCRLRTVRKAARLTIRELEKLTGVSNASISQIERGGDPTLKTARALADHFDASIEWMWPRRIT